MGSALETYFKDYKGAVLNYREFLKFNRDPVRRYEILKKVAKIEFDDLRDYDAALISYETLLKEFPETPEKDFLSFREAQALFFLNDFKLSRQKFQQLVETYPKSQWVARSRFEVGNTYFMEGNYSIATEALKQVLRMHSKSPFAIEAQFLMGQCFEGQMQYEEALRMYEGLQGRYSPSEVLSKRIEKVKQKQKKS